jgi:thiol-disulfide isomerase/thioredoxin
MDPSDGFFDPAEEDTDSSLPTPGAEPSNYFMFAVTVAVIVYSIYRLIQKRRREPFPGARQVPVAANHQRPQQPPRGPEQQQDRFYNGGVGSEGGGSATMVQARPEAAGGGGGDGSNGGGGDAGAPNDTREIARLLGSSLLAGSGGRVRTSDALANTQVGRRWRFALVVLAAPLNGLSACCAFARMLSLPPSSPTRPPPRSLPPRTATTTTSHATTPASTTNNNTNNTTSTTTTTTITIVGRATLCMCARACVRLCVFACLRGQVLALYFSGHWCPPCRQFTPVLANCYERLRKRLGPGRFEVVFVSADRNEAEFKQYFAEVGCAVVTVREACGAVQCRR